ncbi:hypothetical protein JKP88DRAFT_323042 [Tribonema minus]|uniref:Uncharacterized protein n=1 Tax=Tribonema minus TaxID=303371 RepID=A0A835YSU2_9STRA|nr:hypothetical protein JKP88DRAFT_323042 [Tribonema minus]
MYPKKDHMLGGTPTPAPVPPQLLAAVQHLLTESVVASKAPADTAVGASSKQPTASPDPLLQASLLETQFGLSGLDWQYMSHFCCSLQQLVQVRGLTAHATPIPSACVNHQAAVFAPPPNHHLHRAAEPASQQLLQPSGVLHCAPVSSGNNSMIVTAAPASASPPAARVSKLLQRCTGAASPGAAPPLPSPPLLQLQHHQHPQQMHAAASMPYMPLPPSSSGAAPALPPLPPLPPAAAAASAAERSKSAKRAANRRAQPRPPAETIAAIAAENFTDAELDAALVQPQQRARFAVRASIGGRNYTDAQLAALQGIEARVAARATDADRAAFSLPRQARTLALTNMFKYIALRGAAQMHALAVLRGLHTCGGKHSNFYDGKIDARVVAIVRRDVGDDVATQTRKFSKRAKVSNCNGGGDSSAPVRVPGLKALPVNSPGPAVAAAPAAPAAVAQQRGPREGEEAFSAARLLQSFKGTRGATAAAAAAVAVML